MGMSIDKTIEFFNRLECNTPQAKDARNVAIETMRKYQKIVAMYDYWRSDKCEYTISCMENIQMSFR